MKLCIKTCNNSHRLQSLSILLRGRSIALNEEKRQERMLTARKR